MSDRDGTPAGGRLESLTGLRFVAAFGIFVFHLDASDNALALKFHGLASQGFIGVSFFFMLSGFVLTWSRRPNDSTASFYRRRFARIYPSHVVTWVGVGLVLAAILDASQPAGRLILALFLLQSWGFDEDVALAGNGVSWTLSVEAFLYATFPFLLAGMERLSVGGRRWLTAGLAGVTWLVLFAAPLVGADRLYLETFFPPMRLAEFAIGVLLALELRRGHLPRVPVGFAVAVAAGVYVAAAVAPVPWFPQLFLVPTALLIVAAAQTDVAGRPSILRRSPLRTLGVWSFAFYLVHQPVMNTGREAAAYLGVDPEATMASSIAFATLALLVGVLSAWVLHVLVERPCERRLRPT